SRATARGNGEDGILIWGNISPNKVTIQNVDLRDNAASGLRKHGTQPSAGSWLLAGSIICGNAVGLNLGTAIDLNAEGNWWGSTSGPYHALSNPGGGGDEIRDGTSGGSGTVDFDPWIETPTGSVAASVAASAAASAATATGSKTINFKFSGGGDTVFLGPGPGDPNSAPPFTLTTDNGTLTDSDETGATVHEFINQPNGILSVTLNPATDGPATVTLDGPCLLDDQIVIGVTTAESLVYLPTVLRNQGTAAGWTTIMAEDFEGVFPGPWLLGDNIPGEGEYFWGKRSCRPGAGSYSGWAFGGGADGTALNCGSNYPNNAQSWMIYGPFSLAGATAAELAFHSWRNLENDYDWLFWGASTDGSDFSGYYASGGSGSGFETVFDLSNASTLGDLRGRSNVWIALAVGTDGSVNYPEGVYVENIVLRKSSSTTTHGAAAEAADETHSMGREGIWTVEVETDPSK
ncbi:hypothetical protein ACFLWA_01475, partial [Chloroflexota bacterium]